MARIYTDYCIWCEKDTGWIHSDFGENIGQPDRCMDCGRNIWAQVKDSNARTAENRKGEPK